MKKTAIFLAFVLQVQMAWAQLTPGSVAPDFTSVDLNGNSWNLYSILDSGKMVILDISATWCSPCWSYHQSGELEDLYEQYGPGGTDQVRVFMIEGDDNTTIGDLYGTGDNTNGDWVTGTKYPVIDSRAIAEAYEITYFPTLYAICPDRRVRLIEQLPAEDIINFYGDCSFKYGQNNAAILKYNSFSGSFCESKTFAPAFQLQNIGNNNLQSVTALLFLNGTLTETKQWTGDLAPYHYETVAFGAYTFSANTLLEIQLINPNGHDDDDTGNDFFAADVNISQETDQNTISLELKLDNYPGAIYWEVRNSAGAVLHYGGNRRFKYPSEGDGERYTQSGGIIHVDMPLALDDCYEFYIYDYFGDGLCCNDGQGYYTLRDADGNVLLQGGQFQGDESKPFEISGSPGISNNAMALYMYPLPADFCDAIVVNPSLEVRNLGSNPITSLSIEVKDGNNLLNTFEWQGLIAPASDKTVVTPAITLSETANLSLDIVKVNGTPDQYAFHNGRSAQVKRNKTAKNNWIVDIQTDWYGYQLYWQIEDENGAVLFSGGNTAVGAQGGGLNIAQPIDPGAYENNKHYQIPVTIPGSGCYRLWVVDDGGNGMYQNVFGMAAPFVRVRNPQQGIIVGTDGNFTNNYKAKIDAELPLGTENPSDAGIVDIHPNPANDLLYVSVALSAALELSASIVNVQGQTLQSMEKAYLTSGDNELTLPVKTLENGLYFLILNSEQGSIVRKIIIQH